MYVYLQAISTMDYDRQTSRQTTYRWYARWINLRGSLVPRPSITANSVEGLVKLLLRMTSGRRWDRCWEAWLITLCIHYSTAVYRKCHTSVRLPDVILRKSFTRPSTVTVLAVIEGLGMRLGKGNVQPTLQRFSSQRS